MVLSVRLDHEYERLFNKLKQRIFIKGSHPLDYTPTNSQIIKAILLYIAKENDINVDHMEV